MLRESIDGLECEFSTVETGRNRTGFVSSHDMLPLVGTLTLQRRYTVCPVECFEVELV